MFAEHLRKGKQAVNIDRENPDLWIFLSFRLLDFRMMFSSKQNYVIKNEYTHCLPEIK